MIDIQAYYTYT